MRFPLYFLLFLTLPCFSQGSPQEIVIEKDSIAPVPDPLYREDQIYTSVAYNLLQGKPTGFSQNALSLNVTTGILRDIPVNAARTHAIAIGVGYSYNNLRHNLAIREDGAARIYTIEDETGYDSNKLALHYLEVPLEFRWRNSDSLSHKFWRVYAGFKVSYLFADKSQYKVAGTTATVKNNADLNKLVYGTYLSVGWNTWNVYAYYGLTPLFKSAAISPTQEKVKLNSLNLGVMFYIL